MRTARVVAGLAVAVMSGSSCDSDTAAPVTTTAMTVQLAPSQVSASTVAAPALPGPCDVADLVIVHRDTIIEFVNSGSVECELDLTGTEKLSPEAEPSVWLGPGTMAQITVRSVTDDCAQPAEVTPLLIGGVVVDVDIAALSACDHTLEEFFPL